MLFCAYLFLSSWLTISVNSIKSVKLDLFFPLYALNSNFASLFPSIFKGTFSGFQMYCMI